MNELVSVIMPCYNAAEFISEAIQSVLKQTYSNLELIIINDGSTDSSEEEIKRFNDGRIQYFRQENKGQCAASNFGIARAKGEYIKFFDADDVLGEGHLEAQMKRLDGSKTVVASCAWGRFYDGNPNSAKFIPESVWKDMKPLDWLKAALTQKYDMMGAWVWMIPAPLLKLAGGWDERLSLNNDFEFSIRLLLHSEEVLFADNAKFYYRSGLTHTLSQVRSKKRFEEGILSTDLGCSYLLARDSSPEMKRICANRYQEWVYASYPYYPDLELKLEKKIAELGGSNRPLAGGRVFRILTSIFGWKAAKRMKVYMQKFGLKKLPLN
ncbi:MAG: glycosyltransferase family 2 protein [Chitinophagaceae bacterium]|nr:glycosyltransferase family 2 protein [Chitinophagaceae bacterium]